MPYIPPGVPYGAARATTYPPQFATFNNPRLRTDNTQITQCYPPKGAPGTKLHVYLRSTEDLTTPSSYFFVMIGKAKCEANLSRAGDQAPHYVYTITADIPAFDTAGYPQGQVPLFVQMEDDSGQSLGVVE
ncbi:hypothetical protein LTS18_000984, partial [Coniosporium uncinatum]